MEAWQILVLFFRCVSGSIFNIARHNEQVKVRDSENKHISHIQVAPLSSSPTSSSPAFD